MGLTLQQLLQAWPEVKDVNNWKEVTPKDYKVHLTWLQDYTKLNIQTITNPAMRSNVPLTKIPGTVVVRLPYGDIRILKYSDLQQGYITDLQGRYGKDFINAHAAKAKVDDDTNISVVIPWTRAIVRANIHGGAQYMAINIPKKYRDIAAAHESVAGAIVNGNVSNKNLVNGDYLVCPSVNGQPDLNRANIVDERAFSFMFDMRSYKGMYNPEDEICETLVLKELGKYNTESGASTDMSIYDYIINWMNKNGYDIKFITPRSADLKSIKVPASTSLDAELAHPITAEIMKNATVIRVALVVNADIINLGNGKVRRVLKLEKDPTSNTYNETCLAREDFVDIEMVM